MKRRVLAIIVAAACVAVTLVVVFAVPIVPHSEPFNLSQTLSTGSTAFNGYPDCGPNVTTHLDYPSTGTISYRMAQNDSDATVDVWWISDDSYAFESTGMGTDQGTMTSGDYTITMKGCGPDPTVSLGLWGFVNYTAPLV